MNTDEKLAAVTPFTVEAHMREMHGVNDVFPTGLAHLDWWHDINHVLITDHRHEGQ